MAILPISSVSVNKNHNSKPSFMSRYDGDTEGLKEDFQPKNRNYAKVPVVLLMAMTPGLMGANEPAKAVPLDSEALTNIIAMNTQAEEEAEAIDFMVAAAQAKSKSGWAALDNGNYQIQYTRKVNVNNNSYTMYFVKNPKYTKEQNGVDHVFFIKDGTKCNDKYMDPPTVGQLIYHKPSNGTEFCGIFVPQKITDKDGNFKGTLYREFRLDDDTANKIIELIANDGWKNKTIIKFKETLSPKIMESYE